MRRFVLFLSAAALAAQPMYHEDKLHGRRALVLENNLVRVSTLSGGGFIGEIRFKSPDPRKSVNPMRVPHYQTIDPHTYDMAKHGALYSTGIQRRLMSGYMGHFLCFPHYGPSSEAELKLDLGQHGEAVAVEWQLDRVEKHKAATTVKLTAELPKTHYRVERSLTLREGESVGYIEESVENLLLYDRPYSWVQHVTFGPPFIQPGSSYLDAPVAKVAVRAGAEIKEGSWPETTDAEGGKVNLRLLPPTPRSGRMNFLLLDRSRPKVFFTVYNPEFPVLIGYILESGLNPWIGDWQENQRNAGVPWDGKVVARGIEVGNSPWASGLRRNVEQGSVFGVPAYGWIEARQRLSQSYLFFLAEIPLGYKGVADVRMEDGRIVLVERETGRTISVKSAGAARKVP
ncbi:MAG: hypothetical protein ACRD8O_21560 [Bryobacteraceae bacterium]